MQHLQNQLNNIRIYLYAIYEGYFSSYFLKISQLQKVAWDREI